MLGHQPEHRPRDDPELENDTRPPDPFVCTITIERVVGHKDSSSPLDRKCNLDIAPIICASNYTIKSITEQFFVEIGSAAVESKSINRKIRIMAGFNMVWMLLEAIKGTHVFKLAPDAQNR